MKLVFLVLIAFVLLMVFAFLPQASAVASPLALDVGETLAQSHTYQIAVPVRVNLDRHAFARDTMVIERTILYKKLVRR